MTQMTVTARVEDSSGNFDEAVTSATIGRSTDWPTFVFGDYGDQWCGVLPGVPRQEVQTLALEPGGEYENLTVENLLNLPTVAAGAPAIKLRNVMVIGPDSAATGGSTGLIKAWALNHAPVELWDCTLRAQKPSPWINGLLGYNFKLFRCDVSDVVDALSVYNNNAGYRDGPNLVEVYGSNLHDLAYYYPDPQHSDGSHSDGVQIQGGSGFKMKGTRISGHIGSGYGTNGETFYGGTQTNACMMIAPDVGVISDLDITHNLFFGGAFSINVSHKPNKNLYITNAGTISYNRFGRDQRQQGGGGNNTWTLKFPVSPVPAYTAVGNVYDDTEEPIRVRESA